MTAPPAPTCIRFRSRAFVFFESPGSAAWKARLAAAELPMGLVWGGALLGLLMSVLVVPYLPFALGAAILALEALVFVVAVTLSEAWVRGHRTPVITADALVLEGALDRRTVPLSDIQRVEIAPIASADPPLCRTSAICRDGASVHLDLPREEALSLCRVLQRRLFGGAAGAPYDEALRTLDRARTPVSAWVMRLRERFGKSGYRHAAGIAEDELDRALHDAALPADRRVGAALAICASSGPEGCERILRAAERLETVALRVAIERAAAGTLDDAALARAEAEDTALGRAPTAAT